MKLSIVTFGEKAQAILGHHPFNAKETDRDTFFLIVTDDAATYQEDINKVLSSENTKDSFEYYISIIKNN